ncbi:phosphohydrolase [Streptococcus mitis]|uniref:phosphohydrolase n=1 Tax=Streptococcus mitis TaxID=28037 RepID=UPI0035655774
MKMEVGKIYLVKKDVFGLKKDELWTLVDKGYQTYFGEHNFVFVNVEKVKVFAFLQDSSEEDIQIYHHLDDYLEEVNRENFKGM